jgi:hypothetical protein
MTTNLTMHLKEIEDRTTLLALAVAGLQAAYGTDPAVRDDYDAVIHAVVKLQAHIYGVRVECAEAEGGTR